MPLAFVGHARILRSTRLARRDSVMARTVAMNLPVADLSRATDA